MLREEEGTIGHPRAALVSGQRVLTALARARAPVRARATHKYCAAKIHVVTGIQSGSKSGGPVDPYSGWPSMSWFTN